MREYVRGGCETEIGCFMTKQCCSSGCVGLKPDRRMCDKRAAFRDSKCHGFGCQVREYVRGGCVMEIGCFMTKQCFQAAAWA